MSKVPYFDISISHGNPYIIHTSKIRSKLSITFADNEINHLGHYTYFPFVDYLITPKCIPKNILVKHGARSDKILQYDGSKEDIYIADYVPDKDFLSMLPFNDFVTIRPEAGGATYLTDKFVSLVPYLFREYSKRDINILYFPRTEIDRKYAKGYSNIYVPPKPLNGLDVCYNSKLVLTGSGTFAREAACLGVPAVSFFPGKELLSVDKNLIEKGWMIHSRDIGEILDYTFNSCRRQFNKERSLEVLNEVLPKLESLFTKLE